MNGEERGGNLAICPEPGLSRYPPWEDTPALNLIKPKQLGKFWFFIRSGVRIRLGCFQGGRYRWRELLPFQAPYLTVGACKLLSRHLGVARARSDPVSLHVSLVWRSFFLYVAVSETLGISVDGYRGVVRGNLSAVSAALRAKGRCVVESASFSVV
ncbi:hypothetical protein TGFOU_403910 [Toxoplasma gondii FOU]|uniref:Uncharacterized protein n=1 Tax=Toxoplasma gondii FOU TaxID=943167 RepID=A0A086L965_TOXGO|nr:hypothetical protein TGFOU_403910 [Toxoplasma gondii FOU]